MPRLVQVTALTTLAVCSLAGPAAGMVWHVPSEVPTIAGALAGAAEGDTVLVACGTYYEHDVQLAPGVALIGDGAGPVPCATIDAAEQGDVLVISDQGTEFALVTIANLNLRNGATALKDTSSNGGSVRMMGCRIEGNGSGIDCSTIHVTLIDCTLAAQSGRAIRTGHAGLFAERCRILQNMGGAVAAGEPGVELRDCLIAGNHASEGAVLSFIGPEGYFQLEGCTIVGNTAEAGSVIEFIEQWSTVYLTHTVIAHNAAPAVRGSWGTVHLVTACCDYWDNLGGQFVGDLDVQYDPGNVFVDPRLCDPAAGAYDPAIGSPLLPENSGGCGLIGAIPGAGCDLTGVAAPSPRRFGFVGASPNPFNPRTRLLFALEAPGQVDLAVYDLAGRRVRALVSTEIRSAGIHEAVWDGCDELGRVQPAGLYICRLVAGQRVDSRTVVLLK